LIYVSDTRMPFITMRQILLLFIRTSRSIKQSSSSRKASKEYRPTLSRPTGHNEVLTMLAMAWHAITVFHPPPQTTLNQFQRSNQTVTTLLQTSTLSHPITRPSTPHSPTRKPPNPLKTSQNLSKLPKPLKTSQNLPKPLKNL
jgi:hypothetical protein